MKKVYRIVAVTLTGVFLAASYTTKPGPEIEPRDQPAQGSVDVSSFRMIRPDA